MFSTIEPRARTLVKRRSCSTMSSASRNSSTSFHLPQISIPPLPSFPEGYRSPTTPQTAVRIRPYYSRRTPSLDSTSSEDDYEVHPIQTVHRRTPSQMSLDEREAVMKHMLAETLLDEGGSSDVNTVGVEATVLQASYKGWMKVARRSYRAYEKECRKLDGGAGKDVDVDRHRKCAQLARRWGEDLDRAATSRTELLLRIP